MPKSEAPRSLQRDQPLRIWMAVYLYSHYLDAAFVMSSPTILLLFEHPVPISFLPLILPLAGDRVQAGFPSPAEDFNYKRIDLPEQLVQHPECWVPCNPDPGRVRRKTGLFNV